MAIAIILSGGTGLRASADIPKQYIEVNNIPVIADSINVFEGHEDIFKYVIVAADKWTDYITKFTGEKFIGFAPAGETRQLSILNGLKVLSNIAADDDTIIIHDAARPFVSADTISALVNACKTHDGAMPALPVKDTIYIRKGNKVHSLIDRDTIISGQAPEAFLYKKYLEANEALLPEKILSIKGSTEPAFMAGMDVAVIDGDEKNFKITTKEDLERYILIKSKKN